MESKNLRPLALTFFISGVWDTIAATLYFFVIGTGRTIDAPSIHPFFSIFLGSFFLCFAFLQYLSAFNIERYSIIVGCLIFGRAFYVIQLYSFMIFSPDFPATFWFTGIIDGLFTILYIVFSIRGGFRVREIGRAHV